MEKAMSDDFGLTNLIIPPVLNRIGREERLDGDQSQNPKNRKWKHAKKDADSSPPTETQEADDSISPQHIDLRI
jgi:hypothetical protein